MYQIPLVSAMTSKIMPPGLIVWAAPVAVTIQIAGPSTPQRTGRSIASRVATRKRPPALVYQVVVRPDLRSSRMSTLPTLSSRTLEPLGGSPCWTTDHENAFEEEEIFLRRTVRIRRSDLRAGRVLLES